MDECPFCGVLSNDQKKQILKKGKHVTAIKKITRTKNINFLIVANVHTENLKTLPSEQTGEVMAEIIDMANELTRGVDWSMKINNGEKSSQTVMHLHAHIYSNVPNTFGL